jgi:hypothetical protein
MKKSTTSLKKNHLNKVSKKKRMSSNIWMTSVRSALEAMMKRMVNNRKTALHKFYLRKEHSKSLS